MTDISGVDPVPILEELESPLEATDILDVDKLLRACGFRCYDYGDSLDTLIYEHEEWGLLYTFPRNRRDVPRSRLEGILRTLRENLKREGKI